MTNPIRLLILAGVVFVAVALIGRYRNDAPLASRDKPASTETPAPATEPASQDKPASTETPAPATEPALVLTGAEEQVVKEFEARVADYKALDHKLEATLPALPDKATPEQIDQHQQALVALITTARKDAKRGEFFTPGMEALVRRALGELVSGPGGTAVKATIMDENPGPLDVGVNGRYPDVAPVTSMPVQLLETLPKLPAELEYRFIGKRLVLVCTTARIVLDLTPNVLP